MLAKSFRVTSCLRNNAFFPNSRMLLRNMYIQTESTPNPNSMKYLPGVTVLPDSQGTGMFFASLTDKQTKLSPLAIKLFHIPGVKGIFFGKDFITITKESTMNWNQLNPIIFSDVLDFFASGKPTVLGADVITDTTVLETDDEVVATIKELLETRIRPAVQEDGGDIFYVDFDAVTGVVKVRLAGSCVGCPSSSITLRNGVEKMLMHYIPEVKGIEEAPAEDAKCENH